LCLGLTQAIGLVVLANQALVRRVEKLGLVFAEMVEYPGKSLAK